MSNAFVKSAMIITGATFISKVLGSVFQIPLQNIAGDEVLGIFRLVFPVYMITLMLSTAGIPIAISKLISEARALGREDEVRHIYLTASILSILFGVANFIFINMFSKSIALGLGTPLTEPSLIIVSFALLIAPYMAVYRGFFQGFEDIRPTAISQVIEQFIRVGIILIVAYVLVKQHATNDLIAGGVMIGSSIGALISLFYLRIIFVKSKLITGVIHSFSWHIFSLYSKRLLKISIPIAIGSLTMALFHLIDSVTIPHALSNIGIENMEYEYGIYGRGLSLVQIVVVFSSAIILPLIPTITKTMVKKEEVKTKQYITQSLIMTHFVSWPAAIGLMALTLPINLTLFTDLQGSLILAIICLSALFTSFTVLTIGILQGLNRTNVATIIVLFAIMFKALLNMVLVEQYGILGGAWSTLLIYILVTIVNIFIIHRHVKFSFEWRKTFVFAISSFIMGLIVAAPLLFLHFTEWSRLHGLLYLLVTIPIGVIVYSFLVYIGKGITKEDLKRYPKLQRIFNGL